MTKIRINLSTREVEWEGSESFIEKHELTISDFVDRVKNSSNVTPTLNSTLPKTEQRASQDSSSSLLVEESEFFVPEHFGEFYLQFPRNVKVVDKMLIAAYFAQSKGEDGTFSSKQAADFLNEQNVLVTNASAFLKALQNTGKIYKHGNKFKVHEKGIEYLRLLSQAG